MRLKFKYEFLYASCYLSCTQTGGKFKAYFSHLRLDCDLSSEVRYVIFFLRFWAILKAIQSLEQLRFGGLVLRRSNLCWSFAPEGGKGFTKPVPSKMEKRIQCWRCRCWGTGWVGPVRKAREAPARLWQLRGSACSLKSFSFSCPELTSSNLFNH